MEEGFLCFLRLARKHAQAVKVKFCKLMGESPCGDRRRAKTNDASHSLSSC